jgi:hypothetical protein
MVVSNTHTHTHTTYVRAARCFMAFLCPCDRNFAIEDNEWLSSEGSDDKSRCRCSTLVFHAAITLCALQTQEGSPCTRCTHSVFQHYAKDIVPPLKLHLPSLKTTTSSLWYRTTFINIKIRPKVASLFSVYCAKFLEF